MAQVFISYSRQDKDVAFRLREALMANKRDVWMDLQNIQPSAKWEREITEALSGADTIVCLLSPDSITSPACKKEVDQAVAEHKRIIPVVVRDVHAQQVPPALAELNWIFLRPTDNQQQALQQLFYALDTDLEFWHTGSRLLVSAQQWDARGRNASATLRGAELTEAENWLSESATKRPGPPPLLRDYIAASRRATTRRQRTTVSLLSTGLIITAALTVLASIFAVRLNLANITLRQQNQDLESSALAGRANLLTPNSQIDQALLVSNYANQLNDNPDTRGALLGALDSSPFLERILQEKKERTDKFGAVQVQ